MDCFSSVPAVIAFPFLMEQFIASLGIITFCPLVVTFRLQEGHVDSSPCFSKRLFEQSGKVLARESDSTTKAHWSEHALGSRRRQNEFP